MLSQTFVMQYTPIDTNTYRLIILFLFILNDYFQSPNIHVDCLPAQRFFKKIILF